MADRILVVDDDLFIRELYDEVLKDAGYEVDIAANGEEGLTKMRQGGYNLVLLDVMMPKIDGLGVLSDLAEHPPAQKNGPVILLTNLGYDPMIKDAMQKGAAASLIKADLTPDQVLDSVKKFLEDSKDLKQ